ETYDKWLSEPLTKTGAYVKEKNESSSSDDDEDDDQSDDEISCNPSSFVTFDSTESGCIKQFRTHDNLMIHMTTGKHVMKIERC
ncbi:unnamed protein product, partial [Didymodactylos carnosus]